MCKFQYLLIYRSNLDRPLDKNTDTLVVVTYKSMPISHIFILFLFRLILLLCRCPHFPRSRSLHLILLRCQIHNIHRPLLLLRLLLRLCICFSRNHIGEYRRIRISLFSSTDTYPKSNVTTNADTQHRYYSHSPWHCTRYTHIGLIGLKIFNNSVTTSSKPPSS